MARIARWSATPNVEHAATGANASPRILPRIEIWDAERFAAVEGGKSADDVSAEIRRLRVF